MSRIQEVEHCAADRNRRGLLASAWGTAFQVPVSVSFVSTAEARVGRPLTPVSVAGAARRTVRRCAAGVYNC